MKPGQVWSEVFDSYVSQAYATNKPMTKQVKIDITKCEIVCNEFGFYYLYLNGKRLRKITFQEYLKYRIYVRRVIDETGQH